MFKRLSCWFYLRSVSKEEDLDMFSLSWLDKETNRIVTPYSRLWWKQIEAMLKIIDQELARSYMFGLKISRDHALKEKKVILSIIDSMGNPVTIPQDFEFEDAVSAFSKIMYEALNEESLFYFEELSKKGLVSNMYGCHLEFVRNAILQAIYGGSLTSAR